MPGKRLRFFGKSSIQTRTLLISIPLMVVPMLILALVGFIAANREAAQASIRYLKQRENDLRTIAEHLPIRDYSFHQIYGLTDEAELYRRELERSLKRFADRSNSIEPIYTQVRYIDQRGAEAVKILYSRKGTADADGSGYISTDRQQVAQTPVFTMARSLEAHQVYLSSPGLAMTTAMPVYQPGQGGQAPAFVGVVVLDFVYPLQDFQRTSGVITLSFAILTTLSLGVALLLTVNRVRRRADPLRRLAAAANRIAAGQRSVTVEHEANDEIGVLTRSFNDMALSLETHEAALQQKVMETTALYEIGQEIIAQVAFAPTLELIVARTHTLLQADASLLALRQENSDTFVIQAYSGTVSADVTRVRFHPGEGLGGRIVATGLPIMMGDYPAEYADSPFHAMVQEAGLRSWLGVPLKVRDTVMGVLYVISRTPQQFRDDDQRLLSALGDQAAIAIENARLYEQVRQHTEQLEILVVERTHELQETNRKLEAASRHKAEFLANMSHELRTPMNAIIGFTRLVMRRSKEVLAPRQYENLEKILLSAEHLLSLINDILDLARFEAGRIEIYPVEFVLEPLITECLHTVEPTLKNEHVQFVQEVAADLPMLYTDRDKVKQILMHLLGNAAKFTHTGTITVSARAHDRAIVLAVADTGIGIPAEALQHIFEEFRQVDSSTTREYGGTGLGLAISLHLARLLGGEITVQSTVEVGSTFTMTLPQRYAAAEPAERLLDVPARMESAVTSENAPVVLAIDDDPNVIYLLQENLAEAGYRVIGAMQGNEGLQKARQFNPLAIILDILMPHKDGWQVLHELKADFVTRNIPVILLSIVDQKDLGYRLGAFDYLLKPFDREAILAALGRIVSAHHHLLVVDDDPHVVDLVCQLLEDQSYAIEAAVDGQAALEAIAQRQPDVILLDLLMPRLDGFGVLEYLHHTPRYRDIPVIVLTAKICTAEEQALLHARVHAVIQKQGLERDQLLHEVRAALLTYRAATEEI
jgi:signal transduction histidine kinase/DNA-binding response OmpR family regulator